MIKKLSRLFLSLVLFNVILIPSARAENALDLLKDVEIGGFIDTYYSYNFNRPQDRTPMGAGSETNALRAFDLEDNSITLDNVELRLWKEATEDSRVGFKVITNYGEIAHRITFKNNTTKGVGRIDDDDFTVQQANITYKADILKGVDITVGKFATWIGSEVIGSVDNFNWSRSFLYQNMNPFTHMGASISTSVTGWLTVSGFITNGWDTWEDNNNDKSLGYQVVIAPCDTFTLYLNGIHGDETDDTAVGGRRDVFDFVLNVIPVKDLTININGDWGSEKTIGHWMGISTIVNYKFADSFDASVRGEYLRDNGNRTSVGVDGLKGTADDSYSNRTGMAMGGDSLEFYEATLTLNFHVGNKIMVRPEYRYDWSPSKIFDGSTSKAQSTLSCSVNYIF